MRACIVGTGRSVPDRKLTNSELEKLVETSDEWIVARTGIQERRIAAPEDATSDLATRAAEAALESAGIAASDLDVIMVATASPDMLFPSTAVLVQRNLCPGRPIPAFDFSAACSGFVYGLQFACDFARAGRYQQMLLIGAETLSRLVDYQDRATCILFGDAAGAVVMEVGDGPGGIVSTCLKSDGQFWDLIHLPGGGSRRPASPYMLTQRQQYIRMNGRGVFKLAVPSMEQALRDVAAEAGWALEDVDYFLVHQANARILEAVAERLGVEADRMPTNIQHMGNTSAASIPVLMDECHRQGRFKPGDKLLLGAFGSGLTWGAAALEWTAA